MAERKKTEVQTMIYKTLHKKQRYCNTNQHKKMGMGDSRTPEGFSGLAPQVAPVKASRVTLVEKVISDNDEGTGL
jgi:hypothetical protein